MTLLEIGDQTAFNLERWDELCADPALAKLDFRIETDRFGQTIMTPPPAPEHGMSQADISYLLRTLMDGGRIITECPISTDEGVKIADTAWISDSHLATTKVRSLLTGAPEICVEVISPSNTKQEIDEKKRLYFATGAEEVWVCSMDRSMSFFLKGNPDELGTSRLCPSFPESV